MARIPYAQRVKTVAPDLARTFLPGPQLPTSSRSLFVGLFGQDLPAAVDSRLKIDMMRAPQLAGVLVFHIGRRFKRVRGAAEAPFHRGGFAFRNGHLGSFR